MDAKYACLGEDVSAEYHCHSSALSLALVYTFYLINVQHTTTKMFERRLKSRDRESQLLFTLLYSSFIHLVSV